MFNFRVTNVNSALSTALNNLLVHGTERESRNGPVLAFPEPVATYYKFPRDRVLFSGVRNANPTFHLVESLWMLAGRNDVAFPATFVKNMKSFTDDGRTFHGAYGHRWRHHFGYDQLDWIADELRVNPASRRCVLQMWDAGSNAEEKELINDPYVASHGGLDVPCNTSIYFDCRDGRLNMTVSCRSNDIIWGAYGANAVHMSILQEYMAARIGVPMGWYVQVSNDLHLYLDRTDREQAQRLAADADAMNHYDLAAMQSRPLVGRCEAVEELDEDIQEFFEVFDREGVHGLAAVQYETSFMRETVAPMVSAWLYRKTPNAALKAADNIRARDWRLAMRQWITRNFRTEGGVK